MDAPKKKSIMFTYVWNGTYIHIYIKIHQILFFRRRRGALGNKNAFYIININNNNNKNCVYKIWTIASRSLSAFLSLHASPLWLWRTNSISTTIPCLAFKLLLCVSVFFCSTLCCCWCSCSLQYIKIANLYYIISICIIHLAWWIFCIEANTFNSHNMS